MFLYEYTFYISSCLPDFIVFNSDSSRSVAPLGGAALHEIIQIKGKIPAEHSQPEINQDTLYVSNSMEK